MAEGFLSKLAAVLSFGGSRRAAPFDEQGVGGTPIYGGYVANYETDAKLHGLQRWRTASDLLANISMIAAGVRYFLNLTSRPSWSMEPADDSDEAKIAAEFIESVLDDMDTSWARIVRRSGMFRYHGFGVHEWIAKKREDGKIGIQDIEVRPVQTIERWDSDPRGSILGMLQRGPQDGAEYYLPRGKVIYLVDDIFSDSPMGMGWFRHLVGPAETLKTYLQLEKIGYQRDLSGIPIGRAPIAAIRKAIRENKITKEDGEALIEGMKQFVRMESKQPGTGAVLDSQPWEGSTADGKTISTIMQWGIELLTGAQTSIDKLADAIRRINFDMAMVTGTESLLIGREGAGSMALSKDKSANLYLNVNATLADMAQGYSKDLIAPICALNGIPDKLRPKPKVEDASGKDVAQIAAALRDMAAAGAILAPDDPAIDDVRDLIGISRQPEMTPERMGMLMPPPPDPNKPADPNAVPERPGNKPAPRGGKK